MGKDLWQQALESASTSAGSVSRNVRIPLRVGGERYIMRNLPREPRRVEPALMAVFRQLALGEAPWPLYLHGPVGTGKTLAALCLCDMAAYAQYWTTEMVCNGIMGKDDSLYHRPPWEWPVIPDLIVLDELGTREKTGDLGYIAVKEFMDWRERTGQNVAIYISNHPPETIVSLYDRRIQSRLMCGTVYELTGPDRRMQT